MRTSLRRVMMLAAAALALTLLAGAGAYRTARGSSRPPALRATLPVIWSRAGTWPRQLRPSLSRGTLQLGDLHGYPVVLNFFASWCGPCRREVALLRAGARRTSGRVVFLGADVHDYAPAARRFLREHGVPYVAVRAGSSTIERFRLIGLPETFYLDAGGRVARVTRGELTAADLTSGLRRLTGR